MNEEQASASDDPNFPTVTELHEFYSTLSLWRLRFPESIVRCELVAQQRAVQHVASSREIIKAERGAAGKPAEPYFPRIVSGNCRFQPTTFTKLDTRAQQLGITTHTNLAQWLSLNLLLNWIISLRHGGDTKRASSGNNKNDDDSRPILRAIEEEERLNFDVVSFAL